MGDQFVEKVFDPFFLTLAVISHKLKLNKPLSDQQKKWYDTLRYIIPVAYRMTDEQDKIAISDVVNEKFIARSGPIKPDAPHNHNNHNHTNHNSASSSQDFKDQKDEKDRKDKKDEPAEAPIADPEGDAAVEQLTKAALDMLATVRDNRWIVVKEYDTDAAQSGPALPPPPPTAVDTSASAQYMKMLDVGA